MGAVPRIFRTDKGTELPIMLLRGKEYLEVKYRLVWFREEHPDWSIETELLSVTETSAYARATIRDEQGRIIATSHKFENKQGFHDFIEKAETGSIGRALALIGYGTQFCADELDEGERVVDSPVDAKPQEKPSPETKFVRKANPLKEVREEREAVAADPGKYVADFGKYNGTAIEDIDMYALDGYLRYLHEGQKKSGKPMTGKVLKFVECAEAHLAMIETRAQQYEAELERA